LIGGSQIFKHSTSMIDLATTQQKVDAMANSWSNLRKARYRSVSAAQDQCLQLLQEAGETLKGPAQPEERSTDDSTSSGSLDTSPDANRNSRNGRNRGKFKCQVKRPIKITSNLSDVNIFAGRLVVSWKQNFTNIDRTMELEARNVLGAEGVVGGIVRVHTLSTPSALSPEGNCDYEVYELSAFEQGTAEDCAEKIQRMANTCRPISQHGSGAMWMVVNPVSGHRQGEAFYKRVKPLFDAARVRFTKELFTTHAGHAREVLLHADAAALHDCSCIVCIGGDGTVSEVLNAIMDRRDAHDILKRIVIGTIPAGSECALAKMVSYVNPLSAAYVILKGSRVKAIDVLKVHQPATKRTLHSICGLGWGLAGKLAEDSEAMRAAYGPARYLVSGLKSFVNLRGCPGVLKVLKPKPHLPKGAYQACPFASQCHVCQAAQNKRRGSLGSVEVTAEGEWEVVHGPFVVVAMLKSEKALAPYVHLSDGYVDVLSVGKVGRLELLRRTSKILTSSHLNSDEECCRYWKTKSVILQPTDATDKINVDGEVLEGEEMRVDVLPAALNVLCAFDERAQKREAAAWDVDNFLRLSPTV